jgi:hypothetical protein
VNDPRQRLGASGALEAGRALFHEGADALAGILGLEAHVLGEGLELERLFEVGGLVAIERSGSRSAGGYTALTIPSRSASDASIISPVKISSAAFAMPTIRGRK